jgi:hypothetical protein
MRGWRILGLLILAGGAGVAVSGPVEPDEKATLPLPAFHQTARFISFLPAQRALVIASGNGQSPLALYVFDPDGNCVAHDDLIDPRTYSDDLAVEWYPPALGRYTIELRNAGYGNSNVQFIAR